MLVLAATYKSWLYQLVPEEEFFRLMDRTIEFLRRLTPLSPVFATNMRVLQSASNECKQIRQERRVQATPRGVYL
jgi:hypothetical protein